jgi:hypothetical protein
MLQNRDLSVICSAISCVQPLRYGLDDEPRVHQGLFKRRRGDRVADRTGTALVDHLGTNALASDWPRPGDPLRV